MTLTGDLSGVEMNFHERNLQQFLTLGLAEGSQGAYVKMDSGG